MTSDEKYMAIRWSLVTCDRVGLNKTGSTSETTGESSDIFIVLGTPPSLSHLTRADASTNAAFTITQKQRNSCKPNRRREGLQQWPRSKIPTQQITNKKTAWSRVSGQKNCPPLFSHLSKKYPLLSSAVSRFDHFSHRKLST